MRRAKSNILIVLLFLVVFGPVNLAKTMPMGSREKRAKALELLDKYAATQDKLQSYSLKWDDDVVFKGSISGEWAYASGTRKKLASYQIRTDGYRFYAERDMSGQVFAGSDRIISKDDPTHTAWVWDGVYYWVYSVGPKSGRKPSKLSSYGRVSIHKGTTEGDIKSTNYMGGDTFLKGFNFFGEDRIDKVLRDTRNLSVRKEMVNLNGAKCYIIDGVTKYGKIMLCIDPEHGYNIAKAKLKKQQGDISSGKIMSRGDSISITLNNIRFEKIGNIWFLMEADIATVTKQANGDIVKRWIHHKRTELILEPDHNALDSFLWPDVPNGADVRIYGFKGLNEKVEYSWQDGKVVNKKGKVVLDFSEKQEGKRN